jgi:hypothetical protein
VAAFDVRGGPPFALTDALKGCGTLGVDFKLLPRPGVILSVCALMSREEIHQNGYTCATHIETH